MLLMWTAPHADSKASMKALPKRKGNLCRKCVRPFPEAASMKALPKRKGNGCKVSGGSFVFRLNESPSEKEGKFEMMRRLNRPDTFASMKALPKRKGNV